MQIKHILRFALLALPNLVSSQQPLSSGSANTVSQTSSHGANDAIPSVPIPPSNPILLATTTTKIDPPLGSQDFVSTQWVETKIGSTSRTWVPITITFRFNTAVATHTPPGTGQIGMGTLTGRTVEIGAGPTHAANWVGGVAAAVGAGFIGMAV